MGSINTYYSVYSDSLEIYTEFNFDYYSDPETGEQLFDLYYTVSDSIGGWGYSGHADNPGYGEFFYFAADVDRSYTVTFYAQETWSWDEATVVKNVVIARNTPGPQTVLGTTMDDVVVTGVDGDDIRLGDGDDWVDAGEGNDVVSGGLGNDQITAAEGDDVLAGNAGNDHLYGGEGNDTVSYVADGANFGAGGGVTVNLTTGFATDGFGDTDRLYAIENINGSIYADTLIGNAGANRIDGTTGADLMQGMDGDDTYVIFDAGDVVDESVAGSGGNDLVLSSRNVDLQNSTQFKGAIERVELLEGALLNAYGNGLANTLTGNSQRNILDGRAGADILIGRGGDDLYHIDNLGDVVDESVAGSGGYDHIYSTVSVDLQDATRFKGDIESVRLQAGTTGLNAWGNGLANLLTGNATRNILDGRAGADVLRGLGGDDIYYIDNAGDVVDEAFAGSGGSDLVYGSVSINLGDSAHFKGAIERATLLGGAGAINIAGNALDNVLTGNESANRVVGGFGADIMRGLGGDDLYQVDDAGDVVDEAFAGSGGTDTVQGTISIDLTDTARFKGAVERIVLQHGYAGLNATGNGLANVVTGNAYGNFINGKGGNDSLTGGLGVDRFVFDTALNALNNVDTITDFSVADDTVMLDDAIFALPGGPGTLTANLFKNTASGAIDADDRIIYNAATGALIYDTNGSAAGGATQFAVVAAGLAITYKDFVVF